jgi:hypothetical protein
MLLNGRTAYRGSLADAGITLMLGAMAGYGPPDTGLIASISLFWEKSAT